MAKRGMSAQCVLLKFDYCKTASSCYVTSDLNTVSQNTKGSQTLSESMFFSKILRKSISRKERAERMMQPSNKFSLNSKSCRTYQFKGLRGIGNRRLSSQSCARGAYAKSREEIKTKIVHFENKKNIK